MGNMEQIDPYIGKVRVQCFGKGSGVVDPALKGRGQYSNRTHHCSKSALELGCKVSGSGNGTLLKSLQWIKYTQLKENLQLEI